MGNDPIARHFIFGTSELPLDGQPVIEGFDIAADTQARSPADDRHQRLEQAEMEAEAEQVAAGQARQVEAGSEGHGKGIHRQGHGDSEES